jgi:hypothetical protein
MAAGLQAEEHEGYVIGVAREFHYRDFSKSMAKYVRQGHVQTDQHWMHAGITPNGLA